MSKGNILFAWELGDGLGHISRMLPLAQRLKDRGYTCTFAVRNIETTHSAISAAGFTALQAPLTVPRTNYDGDLYIGSYGDVLETVGYNEPARLKALIAGWTGIFDLTRPDLIVADYSPTAQLAALGHIPTVTIGDWFTQPPSTAPEFPLLRRTGRRIVEQGLLSSVQAVQKDRGASQPNHLPAILTCARTFIITLPELDQYGAQRRAPAVGPLNPLPGPIHTQDPSSDYFAYLSLGWSHTGKILEALASCPFEGSLFLRDGTATAKDAWRARGLTIHDSPQDMAEMARQSAVIIHHGGLGTLENVMALGRPQLTVPRHLEQAVNSKMVGNMGLAAGMKMSGQFTPDHVIKALSYARTVDTLRANSAKKADELSARGPFNALEPIVDFCLTTLKNNRISA